MKTASARAIRWTIAALAFLISPICAAAEPRHGIAMHGEPKYPSNFTQFDYVNPNAPKSGRATFGVLGSFDNLNPFIVKGNTAPGMREYVFESLMARSQDEPFTLYGLLAESIDVPDDRSSVTFTLRPEARFSDGQPVTVDDVIFSLELLREKGRPNHRSFYSKVGTIERVGERGVKLSFKDGGDREMPLIMGLMPVLPKHLIDPDRFEATSFALPVGSGPYLATSVNPGSSLVLKRDPNYWGRDLPVNRGSYNFDEIRYEFYRDANSKFEAFKKGLFLINGEGDPGRWAREYDFPAVLDGRVVKQDFHTGTPSGMSGLAFNTRRPLFADRRVREALILLFDFEWQNKNLYHGLYTRIQSYFDGSELSSHGRPANARERELLAPFPDAVTPEAMEGTLTQPVTDGSGRDRDNLRKALQLLKAAGYELNAAGKMANKATGQPFSFETLAATRDQERLFLTYAENLRKAGIEISIRQIDSAQYQSRKTNFDFDVIQNGWGASLSPGNEQLFRWSSQSADTDGSFNYPGVKSPAADAMIAAMLAATDREDFVSAVRALDRVLMSGDYAVPLFRLPAQWVAYWSVLHHPDATPLYGYQIDTWWIDPSARADAQR
ncbi:MULTISPECIES: extracellular solute-binding protein [Rhodomicrobium]|uniref:extracellular solute-binding protein n=1 Tax=Rhodomicrobium TaxID=1068 RepID=UPI001FD9E23A|nr:MULTISPECIES: extracellular solute-binding protein [Rhodomicrobium]